LTEPKADSLDLPPAVVPIAQTAQSNPWRISENRNNQLKLFLYHFRDGDSYAAVRHGMEIFDLRDCPPSGFFYAGRAGRKDGIVFHDEHWIAKYPRTTRDLIGKHLPPYTSSPISEYLGSHIYHLLGIPVHETALGYREGKIVCACKDFTWPNKRLFEFKMLKNSLSDDEEGFSSAPSDGESIYLPDVLSAIEHSPVLRSIPGVRERFWDMFVIDAFIKNPDRNNGDWGVLYLPDGTYELAPVYDNGSSLFSKQSASLAMRRLDSPDELEQDAFGTNVSCYRLPSINNPKGIPIYPFSYMESTHNPDLAAAIVRFAERVNLAAIDELIDSIPEEAYGIILMPDPVRASHKTLLRKRYEEGILPVYRRITTG
jgi:hypothetical protein